MLVSFFGDLDIWTLFFAELGFGVLDLVYAYAKLDSLDGKV